MEIIPASIMPEMSASKQAETQIAETYQIFSLIGQHFRGATEVLFEGKRMKRMETGGEWNAEPIFMEMCTLQFIRVFFRKL